MPIERRQSTGGFRYGGGGGSQAPRMQMFGSLRAPVATVAQTERRNQREASPIERLDFAFAEYAPGVFRAPAVVAERPVAYADAATGGGISGFLKGIGDIGGSNGGPGPIGSFFKGLGDGIVATDTAARAWANAGEAEQIAKYGHMPESSLTDMDAGGFLGTGLFGHKMTVGELKAEIDKRGWRNTPDGRVMDWNELQAKAKENTYAFGDRAMTTSIATDSLASMLISPTNALFFIPGAGWAAVANKARGAAAGVIQATGAARWARPITTAASTLHRTRYGFGYFKDPAIQVLRSPQFVDASIAARELLAGSTKHASVRALLTAADTVMRGGQIVGKGLGKFSGYKAPVNPSLWGYTKAGGTAYYRGALRLQVGSVGAEFAAGRAAQDAEGTIFDGLTNTIHSALKNVNNARPLSDNESFLIFALTTMPMIPLVGEAVGTPGRAIRKAAGDTDAVLIAKEMNITTDELYTKLGDGDIAKGKEVAQWALQQAERGVAWKQLGLVTRNLGSFDSAVTNNQVLNGILGGKIRRMREAGQMRAEARVQTFFDVVRKGEIVSKADRPFEWNASNDAILKSWSRFHQAWTAIAPGARKLGITALTNSKIVTREMLDDALQVLLKDAPEVGIMPAWVRDDLLIHMPGLLEDAKAYGDFWQRVAVHSETKPTFGRAFTQEAQPDTRVTMEELRTELTKLRDAVPSANELYHEAGILEKNMPDGTTVDALAGSKVRKVHSPAVIKQLRDDATGRVRALRQEEKVLSHIRNTEFTRNGHPRIKSVDTTVGYRGTVFTRSDSTGVVNDKGVEIVDMFESEDGRHFWFDPEHPSRFYIGALEDNVRTSEALVKAVELGGRVVAHTIDVDNLEGTILARHGFVEVAREVRQLEPSPLLRDPSRPIPQKWERKLMNDGTEVWVDQDGLIAGPTTETIGYFAYAGGPAALLRNHVAVTPDIPLREMTIIDKNAGQAVGRVQVPQRPEFLPVDVLVPLREIDRETTPRDIGNPNYLDELTDSIEKSIEDLALINTFEGVRLSMIDPVTLQYDIGTQRVLLTDGNHRLAAIRRLEKKRGEKYTIPVRVEVVSEGMMQGVEARIGSNVITAQELTGYNRSDFPPYKPTKRIVKNRDAGVNLAQKRADQASLLVPSIDAIGPSPTSTEGLFHGSQAIFDKFDNDMLSSASLVGRGVYTTDDLGVAMGYAGHGRGQIYRVQPRENLKTYDLMKEFGEDDWEIRSRIYDVLAESEDGHDGTAFADYILPEGENISGFDMFTRVFETLTPEELGPINDKIVAVFKDFGFEGFTHTGGLLVGNRQHKVTVAFDANDVQILEQLNPRDFVPATTARHATITNRMNVVRQQMKARVRDLEIIDKRAEELRTIKLPETIADQKVPKDQQDALIELVSQMRAEYPSYDLSMENGLAFWDPADGLLPGLNLERSAAQHMLFDYGPMSKVSAFYNAVFGPVSSKRLSKMARTAVYNRMLTEGATTKQTGQILAELNQRVREATVGPLRVPWFRDITSLPAQQVNTIAKGILDEKTWGRIEARYGAEGFHHLLDEAANEFVRRVDKNVTRGNQNGQLARALREGYRLWSYAPIVGSSSRLISKQFYHVFRFMLDLRWHFLNLIEADMLSIGREGTTRFGKQSDATGKAALMQHTNRAGIPMEMFSNKVDDAGPTQTSTELFDVGLYLHNRNILPVITKNFDKARHRSVETVLDELPRGSSLYQMLEERFGTDTRSWSKQLDDMMYDFDSKGVRQTVYDTARKDGWTEGEIVQFGGILERLTELNQKSYDDMVAVYTGNLNRTRLERVLNSYWLYWPISYQIKATRWMLNSLMNRWGGMQTNMTGLYLFNKAAERYQELLANNEQFQQEMEKNEDLWFAVNMLFPATPLDTGVSLNRGVRYVTSLVAPGIIPPYIGIDGAEDIPTRMLEMGPVYTAKFIQTIANEMNDQPEPPTFARGRAVEGPLVRRPGP